MIKIIISFIVLILIIFIKNKKKNVPDKNKKNIIIYGRGPSAYKCNINNDYFDIVIKLKRCNCVYNERCDILVFYSGELFENRNEYDVHFCKHKTVWYYNEFNKDEDKMKHKNIEKYQQMDNENIKQRIKPYGLHFRKKPRPTTGLATILETIRLYKNTHNIYIVGFDDMVNNSNSGHYDNLKSQTSSAHSTKKEHYLLMDLIKNGELFIAC